MNTKKVVALSISAGLAVVVLITVASLYLKKPQTTSNTKPEESSLTITIDAPNYNEESDSKFPLEITGSDDAGNAVQQTVYITISDNAVKVPSGSYTVHVLASPLMANGSLFALPDDVKVDAGEAEAKLSFSELKPADITQEAMDAAKSYALDAGEEQDKVDSLYQKLVDAVSMATGTTLAKYQQVLETISSMKDGEYQKDMINLTAPDDPGAHIVVKMQDITGDKTEELLVGWGQEDDSTFEVIAHIQQIFTIGDSGYKLLVGNSADDTSAPIGNLALYSDGISYFTQSDPSRQITNYRLSNNGVEEIAHYYTTSSGEVMRVDGASGEEKNVGFGVINTVAKAEVAGEGYSAEDLHGFSLAGDYILKYLEEKHDVDLEDPRFESFDSSTVTGSFSTGPPEVTMTVDKENKTIHLDIAHYYVGEDGFSGSLDLTYDEDSFFGTNLGSAPVWGKRRMGLDEFTNTLQTAPGVTFCVQDGRIVLAYFHS